jgi:hypothetical protein
MSVMHKTIATILLVIASGSSAAQWVGVGNSADGQMEVYADAATIRRSGNTAVMSDLSNYKTTQVEARDPHLSLKSQKEYNCGERRYRILAYTWHSENMSRGIVVYTSDGKPSEWAPVMPGSIVEILWERACSTQTASATPVLTRAERPEISVGDRWTYQRKNLDTGEVRPPGPLNVSQVTANTITVRLGSMERTFSREWNLLEERMNKKANYRAYPLWLFFRFPLTVGKKWDGIWETNNFLDDSQARWRGKSEVKAIETVTVPAGTFQTFRIEFEGSYQGTFGAGSRRDTFWYAPAVKRWVKQEWEVTGNGRAGRDDHRESLELLSFQVVP